MGKSHQRGWVVERGKTWYGYYRRIVLDPITEEKKTDVVSVILGLKSVSYTHLDVYKRQAMHC